MTLLVKRAILKCCKSILFFTFSISIRLLFDQVLTRCTDINIVNVYFYFLSFISFQVSYEVTIKPIYRTDTVLSSAYSPHAITSSTEKSFKTTMWPETIKLSWDLRQSFPSQTLVMFFFNIILGYHFAKNAKW